MTIQPGTIVRGVKLTKGTLIVTRGGKLIADGTVNEPIIFTSDEVAGTRTFGDWGGIIILGSIKICKTTNIKKDIETLSKLKTEYRSIQQDDETASRTLVNNNQKLAAYSRRRIKPNTS